MSSKSPVEAGETGEAGQGEGMEGKPLPSDSGMGSTASSRSVSRTDTVSSSRVPSGREESNVESKASASAKGAFTGRSTLKHNIFGSSTTLSSATGTEGDEFDDHINVVLRVRPLNTQEHNRRDTFAVSFPGAGRIECDSGTNTRQFAFNVVFEPEATQMDLFEHSGVKKLIDMALNGYACTALAFGQTGSGKTHTMTGPPQQFEGGKHPPQEMVGIMQRSFDYMFSQLQQNSSSKLIRASYLEIYNEQVIDLLNPIQRRYLNVRWSKNKGFYVENLFVMECENTDDLTAVLEEGMRNRQTGSHDLNQTSSRSHTMLTLTIDSEQQDPEDENLYITKRGKLTFVDLAGSEKVKDSNSTAETLIESNNINRSLLVLGNCISSLGDPKKRQGHIPYRDSKLTKLLADSLGGNGVTLMIACITPSSHHASETMNTLRYASRAKKIRTKPIVKMDPREKLIISLKREIKMLKNENMYLRQQLEFPPSKRGPIPKNSNDEKLKNILKDKKEDVQGKEEGGLYEMLQEYMIENEALRSENADLQVVRDKMKRDQQLLYRDNEKMMQRIDDLERLMGQSPWARNTAYPDYNNPDRRASPGIRSPQGSQTWNNAPNRHPQGNYAGNVSPNGVGRGKGPPANYGQPKRPPHHLPDAIPKQGKGHPADSMNGVGPHADPRYQPSDPRYSAVPPTGNPQSIRQESPLRIDRKASQISTTDSVRSMNEKLRLELAELEGEIKEQQMMNQRTRNSYGSQTSVRSHPR